jgi:hypothetical protein
MHGELVKEIAMTALELYANRQIQNKPEFDRLVDDLRHLLWVYEVEQEIKGK